MSSVRLISNWLVTQGRCFGRGWCRKFSVFRKRSLGSHRIAGRISLFRQGDSSAHNLLLHTCSTDLRSQAIVGLLRRHTVTSFFYGTHTCSFLFLSIYRPGSVLVLDCKLYAKRRLFGESDGFECLKFFAHF